MSKRIEYLKKALSKYSLKLDQKGYVANHDGNISVKISEGFLCTPTSEAKGIITEEMILTLDHSGKKVEGIGKPFSELKLHLAAYEARSDVNAVIHAHPLFSTARGLTRIELKPRLPEAIVSIGDFVPVLPYSMPGSPESEDAVKEALGLVDVFYMAGNGVLAVGDDVEQAYLRIELVEHLTQIEYYALQMGIPLKLPEEDIETLLKKRLAAGLGPKAKKNIKPVKNESDTMPYQNISQEEIKNIIAEEINRALKG